MKYNFLGGKPDKTSLFALSFSIVEAKYHMDKVGPKAISSALPLYLVIVKLIVDQYAHEHIQFILYYCVYNQLRQLHFFMIKSV